MPKQNKPVGELIEQLNENYSVAYHEESGWSALISDKAGPRLNFAPETAMRLRDFLMRQYPPLQDEADHE